MRNLFREQIEWNKIGNHNQSEYVFDIEECILNPTNMNLTILMKANFVPQYNDIKKIKAIIKGTVEEVSDAEIKIIYENPVLTDEEAVRNFVPYMIAMANGEYRSLTQCILYKDFCNINGRTVEIGASGEFATSQLNEKLAQTFEHYLSSTLGLRYRVTFRNDEERYCRVKEEWINGEQADIRESLRIQQEKVKVEGDKKKKEPVQQNTSGGGNQWNGGGGFKRRKSKIEAPAEGNILVGGKKIVGSPVPIGSVTAESGKVVIEGILFSKEERTIKNGNKLVIMMVTDQKTSITIKAFMTEEKWNELDGLAKNGDFLKISGGAEWDRFDNCISIMFDGIEKGVLKKREDNCTIGKRVELHAHTKMSAMDGLNEVENLVQTAAEWGQPAVAVTDHGVVQSFPDAAKTAEKMAKKGMPIKVIYGMEGYLLEDSDCIREDGTIDYKKKNTNHIIFLAKTQEGVKNIYKLVSISHIKYFYKKPRIPKSLIEKYREGIIIGSACEAGEVYRAVSQGLPHDEIKRIASFYDYLEIQPLINNRFMIEKGMVKNEEEIRNFNRQIIELGEEMGKPVVATTDAHYGEPESAIYRNILLAGMGFKDAENGRGLYMRTTEEMLEEFSYLGEEKAKEIVIDNTNLISDMISPDILPVPKEKYPPKIDGAEETLKKTCMEKAHSIYGNPLPTEIQERLDTELNSIIGNGYAVMYVSAQLLVKKSLEDGYLVGSRGSVGSSFAATMAGITEVNPLDPHYICPQCKHLEWGDMEKYDCGIDMPPKNCPECGAEMKRDGYTIPFATFLGFTGNKEPDIDLNFAGEYQATAHRYVGVIFGEENVYKAGTVSTVADKTAYGYVKNFHDERNIQVSKAELNRLTIGCTGVKKTTGQHPGGIIIVPDDHEIYEFCPVQRPANDMNTDIVTTHFDYHKIDQNLLKLDILGHNIPSMIRQLQDTTGIDPLSVDLTDRKVLSIFNGTEALDIKNPDYRYTHGTYAIPEFGTNFVRQMLDDTKPDKFADLVRISGFSHGTDVWLNNAQEYIRNGTATMREVISTRDDIMNYLILKGVENKDAFQIMEDVRKNRPLKDEQFKIMREHNVPEWYIDSCEKIKYMFPRAHAVAYVMMSYRMAWYKVYYPREFYATHFTSVVADFDADTILKGPEICLDRIEEIQRNGEATQKQKDRILVYEVAYEMYSRGYEFEMPKLGLSEPLRFTVHDGRVVLPFVALDGVGETAATNLVKAYEERDFTTVEDATSRAGINKKAVAALRDCGVFEGLPETDQLSFF